MKFLTVRFYFHPSVTSCFLGTNIILNILFPINTQSNTFSSITKYWEFRSYTTAAVTS
jgi:hypothetical protein